MYHHEILCSAHQNGICTINKTLIRVLITSVGKHSREGVAVRVDAAMDDILHSPVCDRSRQNNVEDPRGQRAQKSSRRC